MSSLERDVHVKMLTAAESECRLWDWTGLNGTGPGPGLDQACQCQTQATVTQLLNILFTPRGSCNFISRLIKFLHSFAWFAQLLVAATDTEAAKGGKVNVVGEIG